MQTGWAWSDFAPGEIKESHSMESPKCTPVAASIGCHVVAMLTIA